MSPSSTERKQSPLRAFLKGPTARYFAFCSPEEKLKWVLSFMRAPVSERKEDQIWIELLVCFYVSLMRPGPFLWGLEDTEGIPQVPPNMGPPPPPQNEWPEWLRTLQREGNLFLWKCYSQLRNHRGESKTKAIQFEEEFYADLPSIEFPSGRRYSLVQQGKLTQVYETKDSVSSFLLLLGDILAEVDLAKLTLCPSCSGFFYRAKRQKYCSKECRQKVSPPAKGRVQKLRKLRAAWKQARGRLESLLTSGGQEPIEKSKKVLSAGHAAFGKAFPRKTGKEYAEGKAFLARAEKQIQRAPWEMAQQALITVLEQMRTLHQTTERRALAEGEEALSKACTAFEASFPSKTGQNYKEGQAFLALASEQVKRLRKRLRGY